MVATLVARSVTVSRGSQLVLDSVDVTLAPGHRIGLVGPNGVGKSTLLRALVGDVEVEAGSVELFPPTATIGLLPQEPECSPTETVHAYLRRRTGVSGAESELEATTVALAEGVSGAEERYAAALERWLSLGAADFDVRVAEVCSDLGINQMHLAQVTGSLSGGEAAKCSLASLLLAQFDVYLLDEPTNNLDLDGLERMEHWIGGLDASVLLVSHDRTFLERTITDVIEVDHHTRRTRFFAGGWTGFLAERELARRHAQERFDDYETERNTLGERAQRQREWADQGRARVRKTDEPDKNIRHFKINQTEQLAGRAARTQRALEQLESVEEPRDAWELRLSIPLARRSGDRVAWTNQAVVDRGNFRLGPVDIDLRYGERMALLGANGSGKTTLIDLLLGRIEPSSGTVSLGKSVIVGEIEQARTELLSDRALVRVFTEATALDVADARTLLAKFGLGADHVLRPAATLSPGERTRASLALLMANGANVLVLDEPTNHLDLAAIEQLEQALDTFTGTVLLVTHDRAMLDRVRLTRIVEVVEGGCFERSTQ